MMKTRTVMGCRAAAATMLLTLSSASGGEPDPNFGGLPCAFSAYLGAFRASNFFGDEVYYYGIESDGSTAVCLLEYADGPALVTLDVSDPTQPFAVGYVHIGNAERFVYRDGYAYVETSSFANRLYVYDLTDPSHPSFLSEAALPNQVRRIVLGEGLLFAQTTDTVHVVDISDPSMPVEAGTIEPDGGVDSMAAQGSLLYTIGGDGLLSVYDLASPGEPDLIGTYTSGCLFLNTNTREGIAIDGDRLVLQGLLDLELLDISDPASPVPLACVRRSEIAPAVKQSGQVPDRGLLGNPDLVFNNGTLFLRDFERGITSIDWANPSNPVLIGNQDTLGRALDIAFAGDIALVADNTDGIALIDTNAINAINPRLGRWYEPGLEASYYAPPVIENGVAYQIVFNDLGPEPRWDVVAVDVTDPTEPEMLSAYTTDWEEPTDIAVLEGVVYVAGGETGLDVIDFREPRFPRAIIRYAPLSSVYALAHGSDRLAIGGDGSSPVIVLNIGDPDAIAIHSIILPGTDANTAVMAIANDSLYVPNGDRDEPKIKVINFADPLRPVSHEQSLPARYDAMTIDGGVLYALNQGDGGALYVSPLGDLSRTSFLETGEFSPNNIAAQDGLVYIAGSDGLRMIDATDPFQTPALLASFADALEYTQITVQDGRVYPVSYAGFEILDASTNCAPCIGDFDGDGTLNFFDFNAYITAFNSGSADADLDQNGTLNFIDIATFTTAYTAGCP